MKALVPNYSLRSFLLFLSAMFTPAILHIQLFSHTCSLPCRCSDRATISKPCVPYCTTGGLSPSTFFPSFMYSLYFYPCIRSCLYSASHLHLHSPILWNHVTRYPHEMTSYFVTSLRLYTLPPAATAASGDREGLVSDRWQRRERWRTGWRWGTTRWAGAATWRWPSSYKSCHLHFFDETNMQ